MEWQPIATAPRDGVRMLLAWLDCERSARVCYVPHLGGWHEPGVGVVRPTHWTSIPEPPQPTPAVDPDAGVTTE